MAQTYKWLQWEGSLQCTCHEQVKIKTLYLLHNLKRGYTRSRREHALCILAINQPKMEGQARNLREMGSAVRLQVPDSDVAGLRYRIRGRSESCDEAEVLDMYSMGHKKGPVSCL